MMTTHEYLLYVNEKFDNATNDDDYNFYKQKFNQALHRFVEELYGDKPLYENCVGG